MSTYCPNHNDPQYKKITAVLDSRFPTYQQWADNSYILPKFGPFVKVKDVYEYLNSKPNLIKGDLNGLVTIIEGKKGTNTYDVNYQRMTSLRTEINKLYGPIITLEERVKEVTTEYSNSDKMLVIHINQAAIDAYWNKYKKQLSTAKDEYKKLKEEGNYEISDEGDVVIPDNIYEDPKDYMYQSRVSGLSREEYKRYKRKKEFFSKIFPDIRIIEDYKLDIPGQVDANGNTVRLNPRLLSRDTLGHEFGHILIDSIGGLSNPLVKKAREQLRNSPLEAEILEKYSDLVGVDNERLDKEIVAQAIGIASDELFDKVEDQTSWQRILERLLSKLKAMLGIDRDAVMALTRELFKGDTHTSSVDYLYKEYEGINNNTDPKHKLYEIQSQIIDDLRHKEAIYKKSGNKSRIKKITELRERIESQIDDPLQSLIDFQKFAVSQTRQIYSKLLNAQKAKKEGNPYPVTVREISTWKDYVEGFRMLDEIASIAFNYTENFEDRTRLKEELDIEALDNAVKQKQLILKGYKEFGIPLIARFLTKNSGLVRSEFKEGFQKDYYKKLTDVERANISLDDYVNQKLEENKEVFNTITNDRIQKELEEASVDTSYAAAWIDNIMDSKDVVIASMAKATAKAVTASRQRRMTLRDEFQEALNKFEKAVGKASIGKSQRDIYDFLIEQDSDGNYTEYLVSSYNPDMWDEYRRFRKKLEDEGASPDIISYYMFEWKNENIPMTKSNYKLYIQARGEFIDSLVKDGTLTSEEASKVKSNFKLPLEHRKNLQDILTDDQAEEIIEWLRDNSWKYRTPIEKWQSKKWRKLVRAAGGDPSYTSLLEQHEAVNLNVTNDPKVEFYNFIVNNLEKHQPQTAMGYRINNRLPSVIKSTDERVKEGQSLAEAGRHSLHRTFSFLPDDTTRGEEPDPERAITNESGEEVNFLPIYYAKNLKALYSDRYEELKSDVRTKFIDDNKDYFTDKYNKLSETDKKKTSYRKFVTEEAKTLYVKQQIDKNQSYDIPDIYFKYFNNIIDYSEKQAILPEMEMAKHFVETRKVVQTSRGIPKIDAVRKKQLTKSGVSSNTALQLKHWMEAIYYGKKDISNKTLSKIADNLNKYTALNMLGLNFVQGTANVILGSTQQWIESAGKQFYTPKNYLKAKKVYSSNLGAILADIGLIRPKSLVNLLNEKFDTLNEYIGPEFKKNTRFRQMMNSNALFLTSHAGEHLMQSKVMLAMLDNIEAKDSNGNSMGSLLDNAKVKDGDIVFESKEGVKVANFGQEEQDLFEGRMKRVLSSMHGEYSELGRVAIQRYALGRMAYMFRKFIVPTFKRRYGVKNFNNMADQHVEGFYRTGGRFFFNLIKDLSTLQASAFSTNWNSLTVNEKANVRKFITEASFLVSAILLVKMIESLREGDDDDMWVLDFLAYQAYRFKTESLFYLHIGETLKILRSPAASMSVIENTIKLAGQLIDPVFSFELDRYERGPWKGHPKIQKTIVNMSPGIKQYYRLRDVSDQISWLR